MDSNYVDMVDRLSKLPGDVLDNIFLFLDMKDVVKTSVLSKSWRYAWKSAPCLGFTYIGNSESAQGFEKFVDDVLKYHCGTSIKKCAFRCFSKKYTLPLLKKWMCPVLDRNVQEICVRGMDLELPPSLFTCKTLVVLKLGGGFTVNLPLHIDFPSLKTLSLQNVKFVDELSMQRLFSCCPVLELVEIVKNSSIVWHCLAVLCWHCEQISSVSVPSLKRLVTRSRHCETITNFVDNGSEKFSLNLLSDYVSASIEGNCPSKVLEEIAHVKMLPKQSKRAMVNLRTDPDSMIPLFRNLTSLQLEIYDDADKDLLSTLVMHSPNLAFLSLTRSLEIVGRDYFGQFPWISSESAPNCLLNLERVEFHRFHGTRYEESLARYMLEHAPVLREMTIYFLNVRSKDVMVEYRRMWQKQMQDARAAILLYKRRSANCEVQFREDRNVAKRKLLELNS